MGRQNGPRGLSVLVLCTVLCCTWAAKQQPVDLPKGFADELLIEALGKPIDIKFLPDDRVIIASKKGELKIADLAVFPIIPQPYLVLPDCFNYGERGLLSIAVDPDFPSEPYIYIWYSARAAPKIRVSRFRHTEDSAGARADPASEQIIWYENEGYEQCCHYGGSLSFGPEKNLYITAGDKGNASSSQDMRSAAGKIHRVTRDGVAPNSNMGRQHKKAIHSIWALGLRNPFKSAWDLVTGTYLIGDVGSNVGPASWEEINLGIPGANYGWPLCEGVCGAEDQFARTCSCSGGKAPHTTAVLSYRHNGKGGAVVGGFVYHSRGLATSFPAEYDGLYFYADYSRALMSLAQFTTDYSEVRNKAGFATLGQARPVALTQGPHDAIYYVDFHQESLRRIIVRFPPVHSRCWGGNGWLVAWQVPKG